MLSLIRSLARSPIIGGMIIALLIAAFALWGVSDIFSGGGTSALVVGPQTVSASEVQRNYERQLFQIQRDNPQITREQADQMGLGDSVVRRLIAETAVDAKADQMGLTISDDTLFETLRSIPAFQNPFTNQFDPGTYASILRENGYRGSMAERQFESDITSELRRAQFVAAALGGVRAPDIYAEIRAAYENERRSLRALFLRPVLVETPEAPDDETLTAFIGENARIFERAEQRRLTLVRITPTDLLRDVEVSEEDLQALYDYRLQNGELADPATRSLTQWPAPDQQTAETAAARLGAGESVASVVAELGLGDEVALADVEAYQVPDAQIAERAFQMQAGELAAVESQLGWRVLRIDAANDPDTPDFAAVESELRTELARDTAEGMMLDALGVFEEARGNGATLEEAAREAGLFAERIDFVGANGYSPDREPALTLLQNPDILSAAFAAQQGFATDLEGYGEDGGYFVVRVDEIEPARLYELDEVREDASRFWVMRETDNRLQEVVDDVQARLDAGETLDAIAASLGAGARVESAVLGREETAGPFNAQLVAQAFRQPEGGRFVSRADNQTTRALVLVDEVIAAEGGAVTQAQRNEMTGELRDDATQIVTNALINAYDVRQNQDLIDQALGRTTAQ
ncbi:rotamase family protein [Oceanicaulis sp. HTCC2633]|uniref:peptidylprolyl isomerase n=1 Tax=Oceanicaulis sp. HTCC2633 TaxID=314254 RepID=UPI000066D5C3|nr:peptidylprolyl isomerase [Oceanicaulis sp. HTCC2633]EAP91036.1 rotamase family protein [Oceanicaulis sp. HTCC2633]